MRPRRPANMPEYAELCLDALSARGLGHKLSLGGAFGLLHYLDYRRTHAVDAWWHSEASEADRVEVIAVVRQALETEGEVRTRSWGEVVSIELLHGKKKVFSFQIAARSAQLEPSRSSPWADVLLDSFDDLVANKMIALVERGAPRDFRDVFTVCQTGLATPEGCWRLWRRRQRLAGVSADGKRARLAIETHLSRIVQHRPLENIADAEEREAAQRARRWYRTELLDALVD